MRTLHWIIGGLALFASSGLSGTASAQTRTSSSAWNQPPPPAPVPPPYAPATTLAPHVDLRLQGGLTGGVLVGTGGGVGITAVARWTRFQAEIGGRYHLPRTAFFPDLQGLSAKLSLFEIEGRGCYAIDRGALRIPLCLGLAGGRWAADPTAGTPATSSAQLWVGAHVLMSATYELASHLSIWGGIEGVVSLVRPSVVADPERFPNAPALRPSRLGTALELGVQVRFD